MARQTVRFEVPGCDLGNVDIKLLPRWNGELLGTFLASRGGIEWRGNKSKKPIRLNWAQFAKMIQDHE
jgi:hypothetical protein